MRIRSKLFIIMISLVTTAIVVLSVVALNTFTSSLETEITDELRQEALSSMDKLSRLMFERIADLRFLTDPGNVVISGTQSDNFTTAEKVEYLRKIETANKAYASISLYDQNGIKIGDTRSLGLGSNGSQEPFYKKAIGDDAGSTIYYDEVPTFSSDLQQYVLHFSAPLYDVKNNQTSGVLVLTFPLNKINNIMSEAGGSISRNVDVELLSDDGRIIYSNNDQKSVLEKKANNLIIFDKLRNSSDMVKTIIAGPSESDSNNGTGKMIFIGAKEPGFLDYKGNNWSSILAVNTEDAFRDVTALRNQFIMIAVIILVISIVLIFIFARSISRPIMKLRDITNEVSKGNFDTKIELPKGGSDELAQLTSSFENMRQTIVNKTRELLKVNEELRQKDRLKDEFINIAAHELRTPIQPILTLSDVLRDKLRNKANNISSIRRSGNSNNNDASAALDPEIDHILDIIIKDAKRLSRLSQGILDVARIESKEFDLNLQRFDIVSALSDFVVDSKRQIAKDRQDLNLIFEHEADGAIYVNADRDKIIQVVSNLLSNAIKFTRDGTIYVRVGINPQNKKELVINVKDTGVGIDPNVLPELFTKYSSKSIGGIGLGLYISKNIVEAHDGRIWVENNADWKGVTFSFTLPST
ncbi:MAG TPA: sensor histidine kinase [Nitrososphaeraceae archaeon]|nr:sensor histidine kinase [Nitrososphaeraceae archaeon]